MKQIDQWVRERRSVRTFDGRKVGQRELDALADFCAKVRNPYGLTMEWKLLDAQQQKLRCPVVVGTSLYVGVKMKKSPHFNEAVGYSFEHLVLYAQSLGLGTVWIVGTMDRPAFEHAMELGPDEVMPCVSPIGYPAEKMSLREIMMRKSIKADERQPFETLFFQKNFEQPLTEEEAGKLLHALTMVRLAPSAVNRQPWRMIVDDGIVHFYLRRSLNAGTLDMQKMDMGIAMCHFELAAKDAGLEPQFVEADPGIRTENGEEYIASYRV